MLVCVSQILNIHQVPIHPINRILPRLGKWEAAELKWFDTIAQEAGTAGAWIYKEMGTFTPINNITLGPGSSQRGGQNVRYKRITVTGAIISKVPSSLNIAQTKLRTVIVWDRDSGGGNITLDSLFSDPGYPASSPFNLDSRQEHIILWDDLWVSGYIHREVNTVETYWTLTERNSTDWNLTSWGELMAFTTNIAAGGSAAAPVVIAGAAVAGGMGGIAPTIDVNPFFDNQVIDQGGGVGSTAGHQNTVVTFASGGKLSKKFDVDLFLDDFFSIHSETGTFPIRTGKLWIVTVRDPYPTGFGSSNEFSLEATCRLRYIDR